MNRHTKSRGFSLIELLIVVAIILVVAAIAIPNLLRARMSANQAAAVSVIRNVHNSQLVYVIQYTSSVGYADTLLKLGPGNPCSKFAACLTDELVGCVVEPCRKSGYEFWMTSTSRAEPFGDYTASGTPLAWARTGEKNYCSTEDGVIKSQLGAGASLGAGVVHSDCNNVSMYSALNQ